MDDAKLANWFSASYLQARARFVARCEELVGGKVDSYENPHGHGVDGERLYTDVATFGMEDARATLIISSGTHGIEGYCGSGVQLALMGCDLLEKLPAGVSVTMVHALNPFGFSHCRRVNEHNIDLNRNCIDFEEPTPTNRPYHALMEELTAGPKSLREIEQRITAAVRLHGLQWVQDALTQGQYEDSRGLFYGGQEASWSRELWAQLVAHRSRDADILVHIDIHSGLGPYGKGSIIFGGGRGLRVQRLVADWFADEAVLSPDEEGSLTSDVSGSVASWLNRLELPGFSAGLGLEFGTVPMPTMLQTLLYENRVFQNHGSEREREIARRSMLRTFYPDDIEWRERIVARTTEVFAKVTRGLARELARSAS